MGATLETEKTTTPPAAAMNTHVNPNAEFYNHLRVQGAKDAAYLAEQAKTGSLYARMTGNGACLPG